MVSRRSRVKMPKVTLRDNLCFMGVLGVGVIYDVEKVSKSDTFGTDYVRKGVYWGGYVRCVAPQF